MTAAIFPVSYTHLDVYKRQVADRVYALVMNAPRELYPMQLTAMLRAACLLYTSSQSKNKS